MQDEPAPAGRRRRLLSDRAVLKLALWSIAAVLVVNGIRLVAAGSQDREMVGEKDAAGYSVRTWFQMTGAGLAAVIAGFALMVLAAVLLVYQSLRWPADRVGAWLPPAGRLPKEDRPPA